MRNFSELDEQEVLALAISLEEDDERTYDNYAHYLESSYPETATVFTAMSAEEAGHRHRLIDLYRQKLGEFIPLIRRSDVRGFMPRSSIWLGRPLGLEKIREQVESMEMESLRFYRRAARQAKDASVRQLLDDLASEERKHETKAEELVAQHLTSCADRRNDRRALRVGRNLMGPQPLHGHSAAQRCLSGLRRGGARFSHRHPNRRFGLTRGRESKKGHRAFRSAPKRNVDTSSASRMGGTCTGCCYATHRPRLMS